MWKTISPQAPFYITAVFALLTIIPAWLKFKLDKKDIDRTAAANVDVNGDSSPSGK